MRVSIRLINRYGRDSGLVGYKLFRKVRSTSMLSCLLDIALSFTYDGNGFFNNDATVMVYVPRSGGSWVI
jgi:hypothetical protein